MMQHTVHALQSELDNLRADNIKLYEKIKFLQSYPGRVSGWLAVRPPAGFTQTDRPQRQTMTLCLQDKRRNCTLPTCTLHRSWKTGANWGGEGCSALSRGAVAQPLCREGR